MNPAKQFDAGNCERRYSERCVVWVQWKTRGNRYRELRRLKVTEKAASAAIFSPKGPWRLSSSGALHRAFTNRRFKGLGLFSMDTLAGA